MTIMIYGILSVSSDELVCGELVSPLDESVLTESGLSLQIEFVVREEVHAVHVVSTNPKQPPVF